MVMKEYNFNPEEVLAAMPIELLTKHPNILIAAGFWEEKRYHAAKTCYRFMRKIDDMIDDRKADIKALDECEKNLFTEKVYDWISCLSGNAAFDSSLQEVVGVVSEFNIPLSLFSNFAKSMIFDINNTGFPTFASFLQYTEGASVAPASVFLHLCCLDENNHDYVDPAMDLASLARPCATFSYLVHIIRDFEIDQQNNLNYFPEELLKKYNLDTMDLRKIANGGIPTPGFRQLIREYLIEAKAYKQLTEEAIHALKPRLKLRYLLSLKIIFGLYNEVYNRIDANGESFHTAHLTPTARETRKIVKEIIASNKDW